MEESRDWRKLAIDAWPKQFGTTHLLVAPEDGLPLLKGNTVSWRTMYYFIVSPSFRERWIDKYYDGRVNLG